MTRPTLDVTLGPLCAAAKQSGAVVRIEMESAKPSVLVTGKTAAAAAELLEIELAAKRRTEPKA